MPRAFHAVLCLSIVLTCPAVLGDEAPSGPAVSIRSAVSDDGRPTRLWMEAIANRHPAERLAVIRETAHPFSIEEQAWITLFKEQVPLWAETIPGLLLPFSDTPASESITVLLGNQGGDDGFTHGTTVICLDLSAWHRSYGPAAAPENTGRAQRILSHEFTHLLTRARERLHPPDLSTPLSRALHSMYLEGLGNYYSLSDRWYENNGGLSAHARQTLEDLTPILVDRLVKLNEATPDEEAQLRQSLSAGPFNKKWGALPVALWLRQEAGSDPAKLGDLVRAGPCGILELARRNLPGEQARKLQPLPCPDTGGAQAR